MRCTEVIEMERILKLNNLPVPSGFILESDDFEELLNDTEEWAEDYIPGYTRQQLKTPFAWNGIWFYPKDARFAPGVMEARKQAQDECVEAILNGSQFFLAGIEPEMREAVVRRALNLD